MKIRLEISKKYAASHTHMLSATLTHKIIVHSVACGGESGPADLPEWY